MKSWKTLTPDVTQLVPVHYSPGRGGNRVSMVVIHHNAGNLSVEDCYRTWLTREASAHFQVESSGRVGQLVKLSDTAWHAGDWNSNTRSIGIEVANCGGAAEGWPVSDTAVVTAARLTAAICAHFKLGEPNSGANVRYHSDFYSTACPGQLAPGKPLNKKFMAEAKRFYRELTMPEPKHLRPDYGKLAFEQLAGYGRTPQGKPSFSGWEQLGGHTVVDALAVIGQTLGIPGFGLKTARKSEK